MAVETRPAPPPAPEGLASWGEFTERLRDLYAWCGRPKYASLAGATGLAPSAISNLIGKNPLSRPPLGTALRLVEGCLRHGGCSQQAAAEHLAGWQQAWEALDRDEAPASTAPARAPHVRRTTPGLVWAVAAVIVVLLAAGGGWLMGRPDAVASAEKSQTCDLEQTPVVDVRLKRTWETAFVCTNVSPSLVYEWPGLPSTAIANLKSNPSWFVCWTHGEVQANGSDIWYYTQGDDNLARLDLEAWGFVDSESVPSSVHPVPGLDRECPFPVSPTG